MTDPLAGTVPLDEALGEKPEAKSSEDPEGQSKELEAEARRLASLDIAQRAIERQPVAKRFGVPVGVIDALVKRFAPTGADDDSDLQGDEIQLADPEPWPDAVGGAELLDRLAASISDYLVLPAGADVVVALWAVHTHCAEAFYYSPRLDITSPTKGCGKTTLLDWLETVSPRGIRTESVTTAVVFRLIHHYAPTLLVDEVDRYIKDNDELIVVVNAGYRRGGQHMRCEGDGHKIRGFRTFGPVALAGIGKLPSTIADRSIPIRMRKATKSEARGLKEFRADRADQEHILGRMIARWAADQFAELEAHDPETPDWMFNRQAEIWRPLFAISDMAGGRWPQLARETAAMMASASAGDEEAAVQALIDIRDLFAEKGTDRLSSEEIVNAFVAMEDKPWAEWGRSRKPMTKNGLARLLRRFEIRPKNIRLASGATPKGYTLDQLSEAFQSYIPEDTPFTTATPPQPAETLGFLANATATTDQSVAVANSLKPTESVTCGGVAVVKGGSGDTHAFEAKSERPAPEPLPPVDDDIEREAIIWEGAGQASRDLANKGSSEKG